MDRKMLPVGLDSFEKIRQIGYYYIDKTLLIKEALTDRGDVNLFTPSPPVWQDAEHEHAQEFF